MASDPADEAFSFRDYPFFRLTRTVSRYNQEMERALGTVGLDQATWRVLTILAETDKASVSELADLAVHTLSTTTRIVQRLEKEKLVRAVTRRSDQRVTDVSITRAGRTRLGEAAPLASLVFRQAFEGLDAAHTQAMMRALDLIHANLARTPYEAALARLALEA